MLIAALSGARSRWSDLRSLLGTAGETGISSLTLYEWLRGGRDADEIGLQRSLFPDATVVPFTAAEAALSADFFRTLPRARARMMDFGIAACAVTHSAQLWTLNTEDFDDIPGLTLYRP